MSGFYFVHLSDPHLFADRGAEFKGIHPYESLRRGIARIRRQQPAPAFAILTGDLIGDDDPRSYPLVRELLEGCPFPTYFAVGNHDLRRPLRRALLGETEPPGGPYYHEFGHEGVRFLVLDSQVEGQVGGDLDPAQLDWLAGRLDSDPVIPTVVFVHHPPAPTGVGWFEPDVIARGPELVGLLAARGNVLRVFFGHVHMPIVINAGGIVCSSVPSTCYQFQEELDGARMSLGRPGYGVVHVDGNRISSRIEFF
jgi:Icc protein